MLIDMEKMMETFHSDRILNFHPQYSKPFRSDGRSKTKANLSITLSTIFLTSFQLANAHCYSKIYLHYHWMINSIDPSAVVPVHFHQDSMPHYYVNMLVKFDHQSKITIDLSSEIILHLPSLQMSVKAIT